MKRQMKQRMKRLGCLALALTLACPSFGFAAKAEEDKKVLPPQMGWSSWNFFRQNTSEEKIREAGRAMVDSGLNEYGYTYLNMDDCWQSSMRDENGRMQFDLTNFPSGPALIKELNEMAGEDSEHPLKVGIYSSCGDYTCEDLTASYGHEDIDARTFAEWGVEYLKYDYCHVVDLSVDTGWQTFTKAPDVDYITVAKANTPEEKKYEAEKAELSGNAVAKGWYVTGLASGGGSVTFRDVEVEEAGRYVLTIGFYKTASTKKYAEVVVNDSEKYDTTIAPTSGWSNTGRQQLYIDLQAGKNTIKIHNPIKGQKEDSIRRYTKMGEALKKATAEVAKENGTEEKPIFYSVCEHGRTQPWTWADDFASSWRISGDISANWNTIVNKYTEALNLWQYQKPGAYNDPDMLEVGNGSLTNTENKAHFTLWCMLSAPLILGNDVRQFVNGDGTINHNACNGAYDIVTNKDLIEINQALPLLQCKRVSNANNIDTLVKPLADGEVAVCFFNRSTSAASASYDLGRIKEDDERAELPVSAMYTAKDLWDKTEQSIGTELKSGEIPGHGVKVFRVKSVKEGEVDKLADLKLTAPVYVNTAEKFEVSAEVSNIGSTAIWDVNVELTVPEGFQVKTTSENDSELASGKKTVVTWEVTAPAEKGNCTLDASFTYKYEGEAEVQTKQLSKELTVMTAPADVLWLGDMEWLSGKDGWKSVPQRNKSISGNPLTIEGTTYEKGVGTNSASEIEVYLGGKDYEFTAVAGIDDEAIDDYNKTGASYKPPQVTYELWADGVKIYESELINMSHQKTEIDVVVKGCYVLKLVATEGGNTNAYDHADWADAKFEKVESYDNVALSAKASTPGKTSAKSGPELANNDDIDTSRNGFSLEEGQDPSVMYLQYDWEEAKNLKSLEFLTSYGASRGAEECDIYISKDGTNFEKLTTWSGLVWNKDENVIESNSRKLTAEERAAATDVKAMRLYLTKTKYNWHSTVIMELRVFGENAVPEVKSYKLSIVQPEEGGTIEAVVDGETVADGSFIEEGKDILFRFCARPGYSLKGAYVNGEAAAVSDDGTCLFPAVGGDVDVRAEFVKDVIEKTEFEIKVNGEVAATGAYNTKVTIEAPKAPEGKAFTGWKLKGQVVSVNPSYTFYIAGDMEFEACYDAVEEAAAAMLTGTQVITKEDQKADIRFVAQLAVPEGYQVLDAGLLWLTNDNETVWGTESGITNGVKVTPIREMNRSYQFSVTIKGVPAGRFVRGVVYAKVSDGSTIKWVFSPEQKASFF